MKSVRRNLFPLLIVVLVLMLIGSTVHLQITLNRSIKMHAQALAVSQELMAKRLLRGDSIDLEEFQSYFSCMPMELQRTLRRMHRDDVVVSSTNIFVAFRR